MGEDASEDGEDGQATWGGDLEFVGVECSFSDGRDSMPVKRTPLIAEKASGWFIMAYNDEWPLRILTCRVPSMTDKLPFKKATVDVICASESAQYSSIWSSHTGGSSVTVGYPTRFIAQTPKDGGPFCSFALTTTSGRRGLVSGIYHYNDEIYECSALVKHGQMFSGWRSDGWQIQVLPVAFLVAHVSNKAKWISKLNGRVSQIENIVTERRDPDDESLDFGMLTRRLHECHTELFRLERRAHFESSLAKNIESLLEAAIKNRAGSFAQHVREPLGLAMTMMEAQSYDLQALPKRIESQRVMIFNLILQRDARMNLQIGRTNMEIADTSRRIAEASMRDSASMKTIAILTMLFLPGTAVASFFSMTMFNWEGGPDKQLASSYIWVYFVTSVPLTAMVLGIWYFTLRKRRAARESKILPSPHPTMMTESSHLDKTFDA